MSDHATGSRSPQPPQPPQRIAAGLADAPDEVDLVVVGLGVTGAGAALDAVTRGLRVLAVDAHDLAFGTSRWSSKMVHGGLRYLAHGQVGVAHESASERGVLMEVTAPHLTRSMPQLIPLTSAVSRLQAGVAHSGLLAGDVLRRTAGTDRDTLPRPRRLSRVETLNLAPSLRSGGLRGGLLGWDGRLVDDARLVVTLARTAASAGAHVRTRARVVRASGREVRLRDETTGAEHVVRTRGVVNAAGVWADQVLGEEGSRTDGIRLRPSRGTHLVLRASAFPGLRAGVFCPVPGETNRFVMVLPQSEGSEPGGPGDVVYVGLTDEPAPGPVPDVPEPTEPEIGFLLDVVSAAFAPQLRRDDVVGAFAGLRPLLESGEGGSTADLSRRHAVVVGGTGVTTVVGGKLTTYRQMAQDAVDAACTAAGLVAGPCVTRTLPLSGAAPRSVLATLEEPARLVARYGTDAALVLARAREATGLTDAELLAPVAPGVSVTLAELVFGVTDEGAHDVDDLLERRTRVGVVPEDRAAAVPAAERALAHR